MYPYWFQIFLGTKNNISFVFVALRILFSGIKMELKSIMYDLLLPIETLRLQKLTALVTPQRLVKLLFWHENRIHKN